MVESQTRESDFMRDRVDALEAINKYSLEIQYSEQPIEALKDFYSPGEEIRIVLQRSANIIEIDKLALLFRPIIKFEKDLLPDIARKSFECITPIEASDFMEMTSCTFNGNELLSQSGVAQDTPRNIFMNYYNSLRSISSTKIVGEEFHNGLTFPMLEFNSVIGCEEGEIGNHPEFPNSTAPPLTNDSIGDADPFPRAIISKIWSYNEEHNLTPSDELTQVSNAYFGGFFDPNMNVAAATNCGNIPTTGVAQNGDAGVLTYTANYPLKPMEVSASNACYRASMERFQHFRMRWITATTSVYGYTGAAAIETSTTTPTSQIAAVFNKTAGLTNTANPPTLNAVDAQRITYGTSVEHPYGTNENSNQRFTGEEMTEANSTYFPPEEYTNTLVHMGEVSIELDQIKYVDMSNTEIVIILQLNNPNQVLSAYLQPGLARVSNAAVGGNFTGPSSADCETFLNCCLLGSASYEITDLCCRIPYLIYPESTYAFTKEMVYEPEVYESLRVEMDPINSLSSVTTERLSIGGSAILNGVISFIVPRFQPIESGVVRPEDTTVSYMGLNPPSLGDLRCLATLDSLYIPYEEYQVQLDSRIYESSPLIPISNPSYASYLKSMEAVSDIFKNREIPVDLRSFLQNRSFIAVSINPEGDMTNLVVDEQMVVSVTFNGAPRFQHAQMMGTQTEEYVPGSFQLLTFIITQQSLVNCDYVRVM